MRHPSSRVKAGLFLVVTLLLALGIVEGVWRVICLGGGDLPPNKDPDLRGEWTWVKERLKAGSHSLTIMATQFDPELGWALRPGYRSEGMNINALGQRGLKTVPIKRKDDHLRILVIGDSYSFGPNVTDEETYAAVLRDSFLPDAEVVNLAVSGYGTDQQILLYERDGVPYEADIVVLGFFTHDMSRNGRQFRFYAKPIFEIRDQDLVLADVEIPSPTDLIGFYTSGQRSIRTHGSYVFEYLHQEWKGLMRHGPKASTPEWAVTEKILERFHRRAHAQGSEPFLLVIHHEQFLETDDCRSAEIAALLVKKAEALGMKYLDLGPIFRENNTKEDDPLYYGHWTSRGHRIAAEALYRALVDASLVTPSLFSSP